MRHDRDDRSKASINGSSAKGAVYVDAERGDGLGRKTARGAASALGLRLLAQIVQFLAVVVLARLITPHEFGIVAIILSLTNFAQLFTDLGLTSAIVQKREISEEDLSTAFWLNALSGVALTLLFCGLSQLLADFYGYAQLTLLICLSSLSFALSIGVVQQALLQRRFRFKAIGLIELGGTTIQSVAAITLAACGVGALSLVLGALIQVCFNSVAFWIAARWVPRSSPSRQAISSLWNFTRGLLGYNIVNFWSRNIDNLVLGKSVSASTLAFYSRAFQLILIPVTQVSVVIGRVLLSSLAAVTSDQDKLRSNYLRIIPVIFFAMSPVAFGIAACASAFARTVYGDRWAGMGPYLALLALTIPAQLINSVTGALYQALGMTGVQFRRGLVGFVATILAVFIGVRWGAEGVAIALLVKWYVVVWVSAQGCWSKINLTVSAGVRAVAPPVVAAAIMGLIVAVVGQLLPTSSSVKLIVQVGVGLAIYAFYSLTAGRELMRDCSRFLLTTRSGRSG